MSPEGAESRNRRHVCGLTGETLGATGGLTASAILPMTTYRSLAGKLPVAPL